MKTIKYKKLKIPDSRSGLDKIEFLSKLNRADVNRLIAPIRKERKKFNRSIEDKKNRIQYKIFARELSEEKAPFYDGYKKKYNTLIRVMLPSVALTKWFDTLPTVFDKVIGCEVFLDMWGGIETEHDAHEKHHSFIKHLVFKQHPKNFLLYDKETASNQKRRGVQQKKKIDPLKFPDAKTAYFGKKHSPLDFVSYARLSKVNHRPCVHSEFRMYGEGLNKYLSVDGVTLFNATKCDFFSKIILHASQKYDELFAMHCESKPIDFRRVAIWRLDFHTKRKFTASDEVKIHKLVEELKSYTWLEYSALAVSVVEPIRINATSCWSP